MLTGSRDGSVGVAASLVAKACPARHALHSRGSSGYERGNEVFPPKKGTHAFLPGGAARRSALRTGDMSAAASPA